MDRAISIKNLNKLLQEDHKKGGDLEERYMPDAYAIRIKISQLKKLRSKARYRMRQGKLSEERYGRLSPRLARYIEKQKINYGQIVERRLGEVMTSICSKGFRLHISALPTPVGGKTVYGVGKNLEELLAVRFIQKTLKKIYHIRMPAREILVSQVRTLALDNVPKYIIRADVESFYESVQHKELLERIHQSSELSVTAKGILTRLLQDYRVLTGVSKGVPRGIGISAYLSEIYLLSVDAEIKCQDDLFYYARYVDDMVLMYAPSREDAVDSYLPNLKEIFEKKSLRLNHKTKPIDLLRASKGKFEYLGYEFDLSDSTPGVRLSQRKLQKYRDRIDKAILDYDSKCKFIPKKAAEELFMRCLFLTGNARLFNMKSNAFIGVYYSNRFITDTAQLNGLDNYYQNKLMHIKSASLKRKLSKLSFERGFKEKLFRSFTFKQLSVLSRGWKHV